MTIEVTGFELQGEPPIYVAEIPGRWLLTHCTPSWRIDDPEKGFQRIVNEKRAVQIAKTVLDEERTFPNAIVLATNAASAITKHNEMLTLPDNLKFLVVDGQHRLWAQNFSDYDAQYACLIHVGLSEEEMAKLFVEINDNQKRVPSSLRWDLVRLVRPDSESARVRASDLVYDLTNDETSPFFQRIDLTGEVSELEIKQGSLAPEIQSVVKKDIFSSYGYDVQLQALIQFFSAVRDLDPDGWGTKDSIYYKNRVIRALIKLIPEIARREGKSIEETDSSDYYGYLSRIDPGLLDPEYIRGHQGSAGISSIYKILFQQVFDEQ